MRTKTCLCYNAVSQLQYSVIALTETWLDESIRNCEIFPDSYNIFRKDRNYDVLNQTRGGGVLLGISDTLASSVVSVECYPMFKDVSPRIDYLIVKIISDSKKIILILVYIPPQASITEYEYFFDAILSIDDLYSSQIILLGDFNIATYSVFLDNNVTDSQMKLLLNITGMLDLDQHNFIFNENNRILDMVWSNMNCVVEPSIDPLSVEDIHHPALMISYKFFCDHKINQGINTNFIGNYNFRKANFVLLYDMIFYKDWSSIKEFENVSLACDYFYSQLYQIFDLCVPKITNAPSRKYPPWFTMPIIRDIKQKAKLLRNYKRTRDIHLLNDFKELRNTVKLNIAKSYKEYIEGVEENIQTDSQNFWKYISNRRGQSAVPKNMTYQRMDLNTPESIANAFADFFSQTYNPSRLLQISTIDSPAELLHITGFEEHDILKAIKKIKPKRTAGPDQIPAYLIRDCAYVLAQPLTALYNLSMKTCTFPSVWKLGKIIPIFKAGDKADICNYRAITIVNNFAKIFEIALQEVIYFHVNRLLSPNQHGFMKGRSTVTNLLQITQYVTESIDENCQTDVIYTDFSKAFDKLDHILLLNKMSTFGFSRCLIGFFNSYLTNRQLFVVCGGHSSNIYTASSGVPQGSNLGPLLFLIFLNDIIDVITVNFLIYADDLKIYSRIKSADDCRELQNSLVNISQWCKTNNLDLNTKKCNVMSFTRRMGTILFDYSINDSVLTRPEVICDLGVVFDKKLSFNVHIDATVSTALKSYGFIYRNSTHFKQLSTLKVLYYSYVRSKLEYACLVWNPHYQVHIDKLESVQRKFLKLLYFRENGIYPEVGIPHLDLLKEFLLSSLVNRRNKVAIAFLMNLLRNVIDFQYFVQKISFHVPRPAARVNELIYLPYTRTNALKYSPFHSICACYNSICNEIDIFHCSSGTVTSYFIRLELVNT